MDLSRRKLIAASGLAAGAGVAAVAALPSASYAAPISALGLDASQFGVRPGSPDDQSATLQRAIDQAATTRVPLALMPGVYRVGDLKLRSGTQLIGVRGATRLQFAQGPSLISAVGADHVSLSGLVLDGGKKSLPERRGLIQLENGRAIRIVDCEVIGSSRHALLLLAIEGEIAGNTITDTTDVAISAFNSRGLTIARNTIRGAGNNGVQIRRWENGDDGTMVLDNRIEGISDRSGGTGEYGNAVNAHRAHNVIVRGNRIRDCAFSAVRGNTANNIQIIGNSVTDVREVALYSEFAFEGAIIAHNTVEGAALGISVCNFNEGGRLAVVNGNIIRNLRPRRPPSTAPGDEAGIGIFVEADTAVTGNVVEKAPMAGIMLGWGRYLRDVTVTGNVIRETSIGIGVSVAPGAGSALIADNVITGAARGGLIGMDHAKLVTGDLIKSGVGRYSHIEASGNRVS